MTKAPRIALLCLAIALLGGCSSAAVQRISTMRSTAEVAASRAVSKAIQNASKAAASESPFWLPARLNRAGCDCPPWEIEVWGGWRRVVLDWGSTPVTVEPTDESNADGTRLWVQLEEGDGEVVRDDGRRFLRFDVLATRPFDADP